ncbi:phosphoadenylyl-sulfate reductase [Bacillus sp. FJAT-42376]|uniref:phosphoadenylyl-sulfate reductase n=1 Tax=Bacillus sp. FJAT-42376 TaxID=2014076 RepID=UPI000F50FEBC|nr:phosphoadenylyl-sulfate reductase [Bacillus sp. FJAT-42376]AZB42871.1 phosphoadenylyl-sulfate reductase [Bacillus sp. FJAT-42376]
MLTFENWTDSAPEFEDEDKVTEALNVLKWAYAHYEEELVYACSFGIEGIVLIELISRVKKDARIVFLDTELHFKETYDLIERVKARYPDLNILLKKPSLTVAEQAAEYGDELWKTNPNECCRIRKVLPLREVMSGEKAWISGLRREQSPSRKDTQFLNKDDKFKNIKICPLIHWTWKDVWRFAHKNDLDYNVLHDQGYPSIGCEPCTQPAIDVNDARSGRWNGTQKTECGLHG